MRERKLVREYKKINDQELRKIFCLLTKFAQVSEKSTQPLSAESRKVGYSAGSAVRS